MNCPNCAKSLWFIRTFCPFCKTRIAAPPRPRSVTNISWVALVFGGVVLLVLLTKASGAERYMADFRSHHPFLYAHMWAGPIVSMVCGIGMLRGFNWARWLFALWFA